MKLRLPSGEEKNSLSCQESGARKSRVKKFVPKKSYQGSLAKKSRAKKVVPRKSCKKSGAEKSRAVEKREKEKQ